MNHFPMFIQLEGRRCVVVGAGERAAAKVALLRKFGARVEVVTDSDVQVADALTRGERGPESLTIHRRSFAIADLDGAALAVVALEDRLREREVASQVDAASVPVNVVDGRKWSTFIMPSIIDRAPITVAVSTGGTLPTLARLLRTRLEAVLPADLGRLAEWAGRFRDRARGALKDPRRRRVFWERVLEGDIAARYSAGQREEAGQLVARELACAATAPETVGEVYLVGAGPGDPDLLTLRALRLMQQADVVVYDRLVSERIVDLTRRDARRIYAGKSRREHSITQEGLNDLLVRLAQEGNRVVRLKGGDPFVFGRGGEEIETLAEHGIPFQVVPGITAASGCAAYAGIPLTHRSFAQSCVFVTGHLKNDAVNLDWDALLRPGQTVVVYMGLIGLPSICTELIRRGLAPHTPAALIQQGTTENQRVFVGDLESLPGLVESGEARAPTLIIIGEVVRLRERLSWFGRADED